MFCFKFEEGVVRDPGNRSGQEQDSFLSVRLVFLRSGVVLWSTQRLSTFMSTQRISRHVDITFNISTKEQWKLKCQ